MKKQYLIFLLMILLLTSCAGIKPTEKELVENNEQLAESNEELTENSEQLAEDSEQLIENNEQLAVSGEQLNEETEQIAENAEQTAEGGERGMKEAIEGFLRQLFDPFANRETPYLAEIAPAEEQTQLVQTPPQITPAPPAQPQVTPPTPVQPQITPPTPAPAPVQPQITPPTPAPPVQPRPTAPTPTPPAQPRPTMPTPSPVTPPAQTPPPETQTDSLLAEEEPETESEAAPAPPGPRRDFPNVPAARVESLAQRGAVPQGENVVFSRVIRVTVGQVLEIPFRGNGWVYLGELASRRGIVYNSRRTEPEGMSFVFNVEEPGTFALKFFREDFTRGYILNDYVQVIAGEAQQAGTGWFTPPYDRSRVIAQPRWPSAIEEAEIRNVISRGGLPAGNTPETNVFTPGSVPSSQTAQNAAEFPAQEQTPSQITSAAQAARPAQETPATQAARPAQVTSTTQEIPSAPRAATTQSASTPQAAATSPAQGTAVATAQIPPSYTETSTLPLTAPASVSDRQEAISPNTLIQRSKENFDSGNVAAAISQLDQYMSYYPGGSDEAYWLYGQFYEANSPNRNILLSLDYYRRLINEYPQSSRVADARRRIAYLERYYINIQ